MLNDLDLQEEWAWPINESSQDDEQALIPEKGRLSSALPLPSKLLSSVDTVLTRVAFPYIAKADNS